MITKLTKKQEASIPKIRQKWLDIVWSGKRKFTHADVKVGIDKVYTDAGYGEPLIAVWDNPLYMLVGHSILVDLLRQNIWANIEDNIGENIRANIGDNIWANIRENIWANIGDNIGENIRDNIGENIRDNIGENIRVNIGDNIWANIRENIRANIWANTRANIGANIRNLSWYLRADDVYWLAYYDYFHQNNLIDIDPKVLDKFNNLSGLIQSGIFASIQQEGLVSMCMAPNRLTLTERGPNIKVLHNEDGFAVDFDGSIGMNFLEGIYIPPTLFEQIRTKSLSFAEAMEITNIERRRIALQYLDPDKLLKGANAKLVHTGQERTIEVLRTDWPKVKKIRGGYDMESFLSATKTEEVTVQSLLYEVKLEDWQNSYKCLRYQDPSTGRIYISWVGEDETDADAAMAKRHHTNKNNFLNLNSQA